ncbi:hypothetical protein HDU84_009104 [Entophlyctis sp. JEL0112]|nr:hypothetical protein HDU84_009104 [Entophlyctis sp. JEL0112]
MNNIRAIQSLNERELREGGDTASWHADYAHSAYIYIGGLPYHLSEGDIVVVFSQYVWGEIVDLNLQRDRETGKSRGFAFLAYEDQRSTVLAVDNMNGTTLVGRTLRVDHVKDYRAARVPKNETEEQRDARVKAERAMRLRVLPWHLMDEDERIEAARDGVLVEKGVGVGVRASAELLADNDRDALDELDDDERRRREFELDDPMREYLKSIDESNEGEVPGKKKKKKDSSAKKTKKASKKGKRHASPVGSLLSSKGSEDERVLEQPVTKSDGLHSKRSHDEQSDLHKKGRVSSAAHNDRGTDLNRSRTREDERYHSGQDYSQHRTGSFSDERYRSAAASSRNSGWQQQKPHFGSRDESDSRPDMEGRRDYHRRS